MKTKFNKEFRDKIHLLLPTSVATEENSNMLAYSMFSSLLDPMTGAVRFGMEQVAKCYNLPADNHLKAGQKIRLFIGRLNKDFEALKEAGFSEGSAQQVLTNDGKEWCKSQYETVEYSIGFDEDGNPIDKYKKTGDGITRRVLINWPKEIKDLINAELEDTKRSNDKIFFTSGLTLSEKKARALLKEQTETATNEVAILHSPVSREIGLYMNSLPTNCFNKILVNAGDAMDVIRSLPVEIADQQKKILASIIEQPKPLYRPSKNGNTDRLFGTGANITNLKKEVRLALTKDWIEFDLANSQLAIVAKLWNIPELKEFLSNGNIWDEMYSYFNVKEGDKKFFKKAVKERVYGVVFGESVRRIVAGKIEKNVMVDEGLTKALSTIGISDGGLKFINHPLIKSVLAARKRYMHEIVTLGEVRDAFSIEHKVTSSNVLSIMARVAQSYEQLIIYQAYRVAKETKDFTIMVNSHDGFSVKFHNEDRKEFWIKTLCEWVDEACVELDIPTKLVYEDRVVKCEELEKDISFGGDYMFLDLSSIMTEVKEIKVEPVKEIPVRFGFPKEWKKDEGVVYVN